MANKKTSSNSKLIREINKLKNDIDTYMQKRAQGSNLFNKVLDLIYQKKDYINTRTFNSLKKSIVNVKERKLTQLSYILENIQLLGNVKFSMNKIKEIKVNIDNLDGFVDDTDFSRRLLEEENLFCLPGQCFNMKNFVRLVICPPEETIREAFERFALFCGRHRKK